MKVYIVGLGPGGKEQMTQKAIDTIKFCDTIAGYDLYVELIKDLIEGKEIIHTPMKQEVKRCEMAAEAAASGKNVAMISSGDAGVYGMAAVMIEVLQNYPTVDFEVVSGITAASSGGAVLGAPLTHDFAVISLSDLLTPWEKIEKRVKAAAQADFVICLYNPSSKKRGDYLEKVCNYMLEFKSADTCCGYVQNIGREGESYKLCTLGQLVNEKVDMFTTVFVGNSETKAINGKLVTPRGYKVE